MLLACRQQRPLGDQLTGGVLVGILRVAILVTFLVREREIVDLVASECI